MCDFCVYVLVSSNVVYLIHRYRLYINDLYRFNLKYLIYIISIFLKVNQIYALA